jgi:hypothetical protein
MVRAVAGPNPGTERRAAGGGGGGGGGGGSRRRIHRSHRRAAFFTIPHFDGFSAVLIQLREVSTEALAEALTDAWLACAPRPLADRYTDDPKRPGTNL